MKINNLLQMKTELSMNVNRERFELTESEIHPSTDFGIAEAIFGIVRI